jgi:hypothetical protein
MNRIKLWLILFALAMIPIGICFVAGACAHIDALLWKLYPVPQDNTYQTNGPSVAYYFLTDHFGATQYWAVSITRWAGFFVVAAMCGVLGAVRLPVATVTAWMLAASLPLTIVFDTYFVRVDPPDCLLTAIGTSLCLLAWSGVRWASNGLLYSRIENRPAARKKQIIAFVILAILILITALNGWFGIELGIAFGKAFEGMQWMIM